MGIINSDVGRLTANPTAKAVAHLSGNSGAKPKFTKVKTRDMKNDIPRETKMAKSSTEYLLFIFMTSHFKIISSAPKFLIWLFHIIYGHLKVCIELISAIVMFNVSSAMLRL